MIKGMGAIPTPVEISEIMPALMTGLVEGQENPLNNIIARKMWEANKFVMMTSHMESVLAVFINEKSWTSIPESDRKLMQEAFDEMGKRSLQWAKEPRRGRSLPSRRTGSRLSTNRMALTKAFREAVTQQILTDYPNGRTTS